MNAENATTELQSADFRILDEVDGRQIAAAETAVKQALAYSVNGRLQLSYSGIKWLVLKMSQKGQPLTVCGEPKVDLVRYDGKDRAEWIWYATIRLRNAQTGLESVGASEAPFIGHDGRYDPFGRTKALSKAERNACRKQIPEVEIQHMLSRLGKDEIESVSGGGAEQGKAGGSAGAANGKADGQIPHRPTPEQLRRIRKLGYVGQLPETMYEAGKLIAELENK